MIFHFNLNKKILAVNMYSNKETCYNINSNLSSILRVKVRLLITFLFEISVPIKSLKESESTTCTNK